jgi:hypothetical protein
VLERRLVFEKPVTAGRVRLTMHVPETVPVTELERDLLGPASGFRRDAEVQDEASVTELGLDTGTVLEIPMLVMASIEAASTLYRVIASCRSRAPVQSATPADISVTIVVDETRYDVTGYTQTELERLLEP